MNSRHGLFMLLCCLVPLALVFAVSGLGIPLGDIGTFALVLLCPLMHILMMRGMGQKHGDQEQPSCHSGPASEKAPVATAK